MKPKLDYESMFVEYNRLPLGGVLSFKWGTTSITPFKRMLADRNMVENEDFTLRSSKGTAYIRKLTNKPIR